MFDFFWISKFSKSFFSKKKKRFSINFFFLPPVMWGLQGFMRSEVWESAARAAPPVLFKFVQLRPFFGRPFIWKVFQKKVCNCTLFHKSLGAAVQIDSQTTLSIKPWSPHITWARKKLIEKYFFFLEKNDFENFEIQKKSKILSFSIEKSIFSSKIFTWKNRFFY